MPRIALLPTFNFFFPLFSSNFILLSVNIYPRSSLDTPFSVTYIFFFTKDLLVRSSAVPLHFSNMLDGILKNVAEDNKNKRW